ncbi:MAG: PH domain-containing protein [Bacteroidia bacterium]
MIDNPVIQDATFNPKVKTYIFLVVLFYLVVSIIGWIVVPFWLLGLGKWLSDKFFNTLKCRLTSRHLNFSKGLILHIEKTIPLENIQDLSFIGGPVLKWFGLTLIRIETAGGGQHSHNQMSMIGINNAEEFKLLILNQREKLIREKSLGHSLVQGSEAGLNEKLLTEIKNELVEIKKTLQSK